MLRSYLKTAFRALRRDGFYSALNVLGLAVGLALFFLIVTWIRFERSYDAFHDRADRTYRVVKRDAGNEFMGTDRFAVTPAPLEKALLDEVPGVEATTRIRRVEALLRAGERTDISRGLLATGTFLDVFSFRLLRGDAAGVLSRPGTVLLTPEVAARLFADEDPVGETIEYEFFGDRHSLEVAGIVEPPPGNSHIGYAYVVSASTEPDFEESLDNWGSSSWHTYAVLAPGTDPEGFARRIDGLADHHLRDESWYRGGPDRKTTLFAQPIRDIHLRSRINFELKANGSATQVAWGLALALLVLLIPCTNYMNLAAARAAMRRREVGVRKAIGADRWQLAAQFLGESVLVASISALAAAGIVAMARPAFNALVLRDIPPSFLLDPPAIALALAAVLAVGILSGSYPALVLSRPGAAAVLRGDPVLGSGRSRLRDVLVVAQFAVGIGLIFGTMVVHGQIGFVSSTDTGMERDQVLAVRVRDASVRERWEALTNEMRSVPGVESVSGASHLPTDIQQSNGTREWDGREEGQEMRVYLARVDYGFVEMLGLDLVRGRSFSPGFAADGDRGLILNETAARAFGWEDPVGRHLGFGDTPMEVVGVVRDFHFHSFRQEIGPLALSLRPDGLSYVLVRIDGRDTGAVLAAVEQVWTRFSNGFPFDAQFLDDAFDRHFEEDQRLADMLDAFAAVALVIACLGLFGLAAFVAQQRTKEIGVRKVLGAGARDIVLLLSRDFTALVVVAVLVGCPVSFVLMDRWLDGFAYRITPGLGTALAAASLAVGIGWLTVAWQALRAANLDPVRSLRYE
jgi:putative ABC transport system permease protein